MPLIKEPVLFVGPVPPVIGGTASMLNRFIPAVEKLGIPCRVLNTNVGNPHGGAVERIKRFLFFAGLAVRVMLAPEKLIHCHAVNYANLLGHGIVLLACRLTHKRSVLTLHAGDLQQRFTYKRTRRLGGFILRLSTVVTTVTPELAETARAMGAGNAVFIANGLQYFPQGWDTPDASLPTKIDAFLAAHSPVVILVGAMTATYGVDILLSAVAQLRSTTPRVGALIIAFKSDDLAYSQEITDLIQDNKLQDAVLIPAPFGQISQAIMQSDIFVRPTRSDGDSIAVREALTLGRPVVASNVGFRPDGVQVFKTEDATDLSRVIKNMLDNPTTTTIDTAATEKSTMAQFVAAYEQARR